MQKITSGIYHVVPKGETNWYQLAGLAIQVALDSGVSLKLNPSQIQAIPAAAYPMNALRPMNSRMSSDKLRKIIAAGGNVSKLQRLDRPWAEDVRAYIRELIDTQVI